MAAPLLMAARCGARPFGTAEKPAMEKKALSSPSALQLHKNFEDDPLVGLLSDEEQDALKKPSSTGTKSSSEKNTEQSKEKEPPQTPLHTMAPVQRSELTFEDNDDDLMDALGFGSGPKGDEKEEIWPAHSMTDELLGQGSMDKILKQPGKGEHREFKLDKKYQDQPEKEDGWDKEDFDFGAYQPTMASMPSGQLGRRQSARYCALFSAETSSEAKPEPCHKPPPASQNPVWSSRNRGDWLGLKDEAFMDSELSSPVKASTTVSHPSPATARQHRSTSQLPAAEKAVPQPDPPEEEDWLMALLARKKAQAQAKSQERNAKPSEAPGNELDPRSPVRQPVHWLSTAKQDSAHPLESVQGDPTRDDNALVPTTTIPQEQKMPGPAVLTQADSAASGLLHERRLGAPTTYLYKDASGCHAELLRAQARVAELESQVQMLEMERTQYKLRLESLQQRHQADLDHLESAYRTLVQEMRKDYEEQLQRLKRLKDLEIDAVTSATSHTRSLNGIIEQMEKFSSDLHDLSHKMEAMHQTTSQELAQQWDKQLKVLEDRLSQQKRDMEEERSRFQEVITRMEFRLSEQERWRLMAEQSKAELLQHSLEEQQRGMTQQLSMERAELEREKSALLKERQKLERDMDQTQRTASQRESTIMSLAKEQAELKIRSRELKAKENHLLRDRELLEEAWQELRHEKEKVNRAALRIQNREEEIKSTTKLSSQKYEEGERALQEARRVESEHQSRLQVMQQHVEQLKQQEQRLHQERLSMVHQRKQLEQLREVLPRKPVTLGTMGKDLGAPVTGLSATLSQALHNVPGFLPPIQEALSMASPTDRYINLLLLNYRAQQDHRFLENEKIFLDSLKKAPYTT
ncbi:fas-binding factor 1 isoform X2 [Melopsittacus undulatus]|uniref:fas-binding factor 1 isoform X2 n=1 Tax=Melopsittacus undulatus TaxID=13146 RepID=UPI0012436281|nr:fas-binding factor 1 isoform X2 [Melopsittacus undulatus]